MNLDRPPDQRGHGFRCSRNIGDEPLHGLQTRPLSGGKLAGRHSDGRNTDRFEPPVTIVVDGDLLGVLTAVDLDDDRRNTDRREQKITPLQSGRIRLAGTGSVVGLQWLGRFNEAAEGKLR